MVYGYIRVSTDKQTVENQRYEIENYCVDRKICVDKWIEETVSGSISLDRRTLGRLLKRVSHDDIIICSELSRLGRNLFMIMDVLSLCMRKGCRVYTIKENYTLGDNIESKVLAFAFGLSAEIERKLISQRTREALQRLKDSGHTLGRPKGSKGRKNRLDGKEAVIASYLPKYSKLEICRRLKVSPSTLYRYLRMLNMSQRAQNQ